MTVSGFNRPLCSRKRIVLEMPASPVVKHPTDRGGWVERNAPALPRYFGYAGCVLESGRSGTSERIRITRITSTITHNAADPAVSGLTFGGKDKAAHPNEGRAAFGCLRSGRGVVGRLHLSANTSSVAHIVAAVFGPLTDSPHFFPVGLCGRATAG